ncbi:hypothetical protein AAFC00_000169 [Neodothiora populina]|uniref:Ribosome recycling factor domain-containing protein n=1 Tax=Neodothiora populina TaxID=2781224 RepID=A0ABR3P1V4_9PEZI
MQASRRIVVCVPASAVGHGRAGAAGAAGAARVVGETTGLIPRRTCRFQPGRQLAPAATICIRSFSQTTHVQKKGGKAAREASRSESTSPSSSKSSSSSSPSTVAAAADDPSDFTTLEADISKAIERLKSDLSKLRSGGRFNPEVLEGLRVHLHSASSSAGAGHHHDEKGSAGKHSKSGKESDSASAAAASQTTTTVKLSDVSHVVPKGRTVQILVNESDYLKPVTSAIQSSSLNLTPQPDPTGQNALMLVLQIPPPTAESRKQAINAASKAGESANTAIRNARGAQQKKIRAAEKAKSVRPDDLKKIGVAMEKVVEKGTAEVKRVVEGARKALDV